MSALPQSVIHHFRRGEYVEADSICAALLEMQPDNGDALHMRGILALGRKDFPAAVSFLSAATAGARMDPELLTNFGMALLGAGQLGEAADILGAAIDLDPGAPQARLYLARCKLHQLELEEAERYVDEVLAAQPQWPEALEVKAAILLRAGRIDEADASAREVIQREPTRSDCYRILADIFLRRRRYQKALVHYRGALERDPTNAEALSNLTVLLVRLGRHDSAAAIGRKALRFQPNNPSARYNLALSLLARGEFEEGWRHYSARHDRPGNVLAQRPMAIPRLANPPQRGTHVLAWADQGPGEQIMFASMMPELIDTGASISLECDARLTDLFRRSFPHVKVLSRAGPSHPPAVKEVDGQFSLADAAAWLRPSFDSFPRHGGYLKPDPDRVAQLRARYRGGKKPLIGISWRTTYEAKISREKTLPLPEWKPLLQIPGITFVSLQYGPTNDEISIAELATGVRIVSDPQIDPLLDLDTFAAQVAAMDLVITTSNTAAHMAGALNVPTWVFVPVGTGGLWHWFLGREDSPWYPSVRLFRQAKMGNWSGVLDSASAALADFIAPEPPT